MDNNITKEIFIALVGGIGVDFENTIGAIQAEFNKIPDVSTRVIKLSKLIKCFEDSNTDFHQDEPRRIECFMNKANDLRDKFEKNSFLAILAINEIFKIKLEDSKNDTKKSNYSVYIIDSLKRSEEASLLRNVYGRNFILVGIQTSMSKREANIKEKTDAKNYTNEDDLSKKITELISKDFKETEERHRDCGQNVINVFPNAHFFIDTEYRLNDSIKRFVDIIFGHPYHTPTIDERNMFYAKGISLRSSDPSRQVGAVIANDAGDIIASGCNEVPKFDGGFYEPDDYLDGRDFQRGNDTNVTEKKDILKELLDILKYSNNMTDIDSLYDTLDKEGAQFADLLEFGRIVHAELAAICDAACRGVSLKGSTMYCTTFPCHLCIKHILAVGIKRLVYIDPYPKSKAEKLFEESVTTDKSVHKNRLLIESFVGVSPRRFLHVFKQDKNRKSDKQKLKSPQRNITSLYLSERSPLDYLLREIAVLKKAIDKIKEFSELEIVNYKKINNEYGKLKNLKFVCIDELSNNYWDKIVK